MGWRKGGYLSPSKTINLSISFNNSWNPRFFFFFKEALDHPSLRKIEARFFDSQDSISSKNWVETFFFGIWLRWVPVIPSRDEVEVAMWIARRVPPGIWDENGVEVEWNCQQWCNLIFESVILRYETQVRIHFAPAVLDWWRKSNGVQNVWQSESRITVSSSWFLQKSDLPHGHFFWDHDSES